MKAMWGVLVPVAAVVAAKALGLFTFGLVASGSMEPTLEQGSLFIGFAATPEVGDIVVFHLPTGEQAVHRVVAVTPEGLVTQGDANAGTDQALGFPHVDPMDVQVVPTVVGKPVALQGPFVKPAGIAALQVIVLAVALRTFVKDRDTPATRRVRPHHMVLVAAVLVLVASPVLHDQVEATGEIGVRASVIPTMTRVTSDAGTQVLTLGPLKDTVVPAEGTVEVVSAPALPGAAYLSQYGAVFAVLPAVALLGTTALVLRREGY